VAEETTVRRFAVNEKPRTLDVAEGSQERAGRPDVAFFDVAIGEGDDMIALDVGGRFC
jgi:hypothetical protein